MLAAGKKAFYSQDAQIKWLQLQEELLRLSNKNKLIIAEQSGHYIQKDEPHYITDAVRWIIEVREREMCTLYFNIIGK